MPFSAIITGAALFALGPIFYLLGEPGSRSFTAFIPSFFGFIILVCGIVARNPARTKMAMHAAVGFGLLGALGGLARGIPKWPALFNGSLIEGRLAATSTLLMFVICALFVAMSAGRFIQMRKAR